MSDPNPNRTVKGCLQLARSGGHHPCQCAIDADLLIARLTTELEQMRKANAALGKLSESLMLYEDKYYDEAKALLKTITVTDGRGSQ